MSGFYRLFFYCAEAKIVKGINGGLYAVGAAVDGDCLIFKGYCVGKLFGIESLGYSFYAFGAMHFGNFECSHNFSPL